MTRRYLNFSTGNELLDEAIENYLMYGLEPGAFLTSVICNNLFLAASSADYHNSKNLALIAKNIYFNMPSGTIGNKKIMQDWIKDVDQRRSKYAYTKEREYTIKSLKGTVCEKNTQDTPF